MYQFFHGSLTPGQTVYFELGVDYYATVLALCQTGDYLNLQINGTPVFSIRPNLVSTISLDAGQILYVEAPSGASASMSYVVVLAPKWTLEAPSSP